MKVMPDGLYIEDWLEITGKVAVVTGAAGGIGQAIALSFVRAGCKVALLDKDLVACESLLTQLKAESSNVVAFECDVGNEDQIKNVAVGIEECFGPVDILVNNAAILGPGSLSEISLEAWNQVININLTGYLLCARIFAEQMKGNGGGVLIHTGSISGQYPQAFSGAYSVVKAGVKMLSQLLAVELGEYGIRSNTVCPAMVLTPMSESFYKDPVIRKQREAMVPAGRIGMPDDIADAVIWLSSARSSYVTGEDIQVDGGLQRNLLSFIPRPGYSGSN